MNKSRLLIIGANGGTGRQCVEQALAAGHQVTAILRNPANLPIVHDKLQIIKGDVLDPASLTAPIKEAQVIISAIGSKGNKPTTLYSQGVTNILNEMKKAGARRAFFISASALDISPVNPLIVRLAAKYIVQKLLSNMYADLRQMESIIKESEADYSIIRPPRLTNKPVTGRYRFAIDSYLKNCLSIARPDVAHFMLNNISNGSTYKTTIEIAY